MHGMGESGMAAKRIIINGLVLLFCFAHASLSAGDFLVNPSFEEGMTGWHASPSERQAKDPFARIDESRARHGKRSLRVDARKAGSVGIIQIVRNRRPGKRFELSYSFKADGAFRRGALHEVIRYFKRTSDGKTVPFRDDYHRAIFSPYLVDERTEKGWTVRALRFEMMKEVDHVKVEFRIAGGSKPIWIDDVRVREIPKGPLGEGLWFYDVLQAELGKPLAARFQILYDAKSAFLKSADRYNELLVRVSFARDASERLARVAAWAGKGGVARAAADRVDALEKELNRAYRIYQKLFFAKESGELAVQLDPLLEKFAPKVDAERDRLARELASLQDECRKRSLTWEAPLPPDVKPYAISPEGTPNGIIFGCLSKTTHAKLERHLKIGLRLRVTNRFAGVRGRGKPIDWAANIPQMEKEIKLDAPFVGLAVPFESHMKNPTPHDWWTKHKKDPEIMRVGEAHQPASAGSYDKVLNFFHPEVRRMVRAEAEKVSRLLAARTDVLFKTYCMEPDGPYDTHRNFRAAHCSHGLKSFRTTLEKRYGSIEALNKAWRSRYKSFDEIKPPRDIKHMDRPNASPLGYEFEKWLMESYMDWLNWIYAGFKEGDPKGVVMTSHNGIISAVEPERIFESCDVVGWHSGYSRQWPFSGMLQSMMRFYPGKSLGQFESAWGIQDDCHRPGDERVQRRTIMKHAYRMALTDMHVQMFWYAYTRGTFMPYYRGNWFHPATDVTTYRYSITGLPVAMENLERLSGVFRATRKVRSRVLMLHPTTSCYHQYHGRASRADEMHVWLFLRRYNYEMEYLPEAFLLDGREKLDRYDVVFLPFMPYFPDGLTERLEPWVAAGGTLIMTGPAGVFDKFGFPDGRLLKKVFGVVPKPPQSVLKNPTGWTGEGAAEGELFVKSYGKGKAVYIRHRFMDERNFPGFDEKVLDVLARSTARFAAAAEDRVQLWLRASPDGDRILFLFNPDSDTFADDTITLRASGVKLVDIEVPNGFPVPATSDGKTTRFKISLAPAGLTGIKITGGKRGTFK